MHAAAQTYIKQLIFMNRRISLGGSVLALVLIGESTTTVIGTFT